MEVMEILVACRDKKSQPSNCNGAQPGYDPAPKPDSGHSPIASAQETIPSEHTIYAARPYAARRGYREQRKPSFANALRAEPTRRAPFARRRTHAVALPVT